MRIWLRKFRGMLGIGTLWGLIGSVVGGIGGLISGIVGGGSFPGTVATGMFWVGSVGFLLGSGFAGVLMVMERRRTLEELTPGRAAIWGALAGAAVPAVGILISVGLSGSVLSLSELVVVGLAAAGSYGALTAGLAAGTLALAKKAPAALEAGSPLDDAESLPQPNGEGAQGSVP